MDRLVVSVDLGGTHLRTAVCTASGEILSHTKTDTQAEQGSERVVQRMADLVQKTIAEYPSERILGVAIGAPGPLNPHTGVIIDTPNLPGFENFPLRERMSKMIGLPVLVENDANAAAVGEHHFGAGKAFAHMVYLTISTGIGGGIIIDNKLLWGAKGLAGEVGHMSLEPYGPRCSCGNIGCLEVLAAGPAIARNAREAIRDGRDTTILERVPGHDIEQITAQEVTEAAQAGDALARELLAQAGFYIGIGIVNLLHILNPGRVVIGGGVSFAGDLLFEPIRATVAERAPAAYREGVDIVPAGLGDNAGLLGAAALAFENLEPARA